MKTTVRKIGLGLAFVLCFVISKSQTSTFVKTIVVNINNKVELTDLSGQALKKGALYRVQLAVVSTGTRTGTVVESFWTIGSIIWTSVREVRTIV